MNKTQQWVFDVVSKMDDDEARMFALLVADDLHDRTIEGNQRQLRGEFARIQKSIDDDLGRHFLRRLRAGDDPEQLVAEAAAVSIAKAQHWENDWYQYQERTKGGQFGRMTGSQYRQAKKQVKQGAKTQQKYDLAQLKSGGKLIVDDAQGRNLDARQLRSGRHMAVAQGVENVGRDLDAPVRNFEERFNQRPSSQSNATTTMNRIDASGRAVRDLGVITNTTSLTAAGQLAHLAGHYGPEAEKVVGPSMRKAAYRYRGTERRPDKVLTTEMETSASRLLRREGKEAPTGTKPIDNLTPAQRAWVAEDAAINYLVGNVGSTYEQAGKHNVQQSDLRRAKSRIPTHTLSNLHLQAGKVTPSEGILIDAEGNVAAQAVGFAEDHYLPFNLKNLGALKGGSYVRTRESGGLTSEDIYTGLLSGARSMTVVSNSGVFTMHFDDDLRGGRRYNDKAKQMVGRYEQTLDAIQSNQVENPAKRMSASERAQIRMEVAEKAKATGIDYTDEEIDNLAKDAIKERSRKPRLTPEQEMQIAERADQMMADDPTARGKATATEWQHATREKLLEAKAGANYRLDAEGYRVALQAMQEQFPYYVDDVEFITPDGEATSSHQLPPGVFRSADDKGYVKPRYNRPAAAQSGFFDTTITGEGKRGADRTDYQNWRVQRDITGATDATKPVPRAAAAAAAESGEAGSVQERIRARAKSETEAVGSVARKKEVETAVKGVATEWQQAHEQTKRDNNGVGVLTAHGQPKTLELIGKPKEEWDDFIAANADDLQKELVGLADSSWGRTLRNTANLSEAELNPFKSIDAKYNKKTWDETKLQGRKSPLEPMGMDDDTAKATVGNTAVQGLLEQHADDAALRSYGDQTREKLELATARSRPAHELKALQNQVRNIELARAFRARTPTSTAPGEAAAQPPSLADQFEGYAKALASSNSDSGKVVQMLDNLFDHPDYATIPEDKRRAMIQRYRP